METITKRIPKNAFDNLPKSWTGRMETWLPNEKSAKYELINNVGGRLFKVGIRADIFTDQSWINAAVWSKSAGWLVIFTNPLSDFMKIETSEYIDPINMFDDYRPEFEQIAGVVMGRAVALMENIA